MTGIKAGTVTITATSNNGKKATCTVSVAESPVKTIVKNNSTLTYTFSSNSLKYDSYKLNRTTALDSNTEVGNGTVLTFIWMKNPVTQIRKISSYPSNVNITKMLNNYLSSHTEYKDKQIIGFNASAVYIGSHSQGSYCNRTYYEVNQGQVVNYYARIGDGTYKDYGHWTTPTTAGFKYVCPGEAVGLNKNGNLETVQISSDNIESQGSKYVNTWWFSGTVLDNYKLKVSQDSARANRQQICQVDANNFIMFTSTSTPSKSNGSRTSVYNAATVLKALGCRYAYNLDGGGSTSMSIKNSGSLSANKIIGTHNDSGSQRSVSDLIMFVEE